MAPNVFRTSVPDHCLSFYFGAVRSNERVACAQQEGVTDLVSLVVNKTGTSNLERSAFELKSPKLPATKVLCPFDNRLANTVCTKQMLFNHVH